MKAVRSSQRLPVLAADAHKGDRGTVLVVAGSRNMLGAAVLCATAAHRGGAGLVQVSLPTDLQPLLPLAVPSVTTLSRQPRRLMSAIAAAQAIVVGPGLGQAAATQRLVDLVLRHSQVPVLLDADALNVCSPWRRAALACPLVITPHPGEAARLLGVSTAEVQADRQVALQQLVARSGACVVLKGAATLVGQDERYWRNQRGSVALATGGSGDVLAGLLAALLAQGMAPFAAACLATELHGRAGEQLWRRCGRGSLASDLPLAIAAELARRERRR